MSNVGGRPQFGAFAAFVLIYIFFAIATQRTGFVSLNGTAGWLNLAAEMGLVAIPAGLLMIAPECDLSIGSTVGCASMVVAVLTGHYGLPVWPAIFLALSAGVLIGLIKGLAVVRTELPSFIVTLATNFIVIGATMGVSRLITNMTSGTIYSSESAKALFVSRLGDGNISILWWFLVVGLSLWILSRTTFGNWIYATGVTKLAARGAGAPEERPCSASFPAAFSTPAGLLTGFNCSSVDF